MKTEGTHPIALLAKMFSALTRVEWAVSRGYSVGQTDADVISAAYRAVSLTVNGLEETDAIKWSFELVLDLEDRVNSASAHADTKDTRRALEDALREARRTLAAALARCAYEIAAEPEEDEEIETTTATPVAVGSAA